MSESPPEKDQPGSTNRRSRRGSLDAINALLNKPQPASPPDPSEPPEQKPAPSRADRLKKAQNLFETLAGNPVEVDETGSLPESQAETPPPQDDKPKPLSREERLRKARGLFEPQTEPEVSAPAEQAPAEQAPGESASSVPAAQTPLQETLSRKEKASARLEALLGSKTQDTPTPTTRRASGRAAGGALESLFAEKAETESLVVPPELEAYLSPELWRKLQSKNPRRGVLINALDRMRTVLYQISTFLPSHLVQEKMRHPVAGLVSGKFLSGSLLFSDVSGFTALSERLAILGPEGAEQLTRIMNDYFSAMLEILSWSGGVLLKFAGDATLVYFPEQRRQLHAQWAVRAGLRMLQAIDQFQNIPTPSEKVNLKMKVGIASGEFLAANLGSAGRMEYGLFGETVNRTLRAEGATTGPGQLIVDTQTAEALGDTFEIIQRKRQRGFFLVKPGKQALGSFEIQAKARRARGAIPWNANPESILAEMDLVRQQIEALTPYLAPELVERVIAHAKQRRISSEFRPTTVLFCNFRGPEDLLEGWGKPGLQRVTSLLSAYFQAMNEVIQRYGGMVSRIDPYSQGTKMLILFGAPVSHEDDPQRAVSAALTMNVELQALNERLRQRFARHLPPNYTQPLLQHRLGITYGETYAGLVGSANRREYTVMGDQVNLAARLMSAAQPGQILLSPEMYTAVQDYFVVTELPAIRVKGKSKPIPLVQVDGPSDNTLHTRMERRGPLIGRQAELKQVYQLLEQTLAGRGVLLRLLGPAGIGKSHLADELLRRCQLEKMTIFSHHCRSYNNETPYAAWSNLLKSMASITSIDLPQSALEKSRRFASDLGLDLQVARPLAYLMGVKPEQQSDASPTQEPTEQATPKAGNDYLGQIIGSRRQRRGSSLAFFDQLDSATQSNESGQLWQPLGARLSEKERQELQAVVLHLFEKLIQKQDEAGKIAVFFEDAHWMDAQSEALLGALVGAFADQPLLLLTAQREASQPPIAGEVRLEIKPLTPQGTHDLVTHILISDLSGLIHKQSGGNPLYVDEITRWIQRNRKLSAADLDEILQASNILQKLVLSGVENLPEGPREVVRLAAVIGEEFRVSELQALLGENVDPVTLSRYLRDLSAARLIRLVEAGVDRLYAFQQSLVKDVLYHSLPFERRRELHGKIADHLAAPRSGRRDVRARLSALLDARPGDNRAQEAAMIADHYEQANRFLEAGKYQLLAANEAHQAGAPGQAANNYQRSLSHLTTYLAQQPDHSEAQRLRLEAQVGIGEMSLLQDNLPAALSAFQNAHLALAEGMPAQQKARLFSRLALLLPLQGKLEEAQQMIEAAFHATDLAHNLTACVTRAWLLWRKGLPAAQEWITASQALLDDHSNPQAEMARLLLEALALDYLPQEEKQPAFEAVQGTYLAAGMSTGSALLSLRRGQQSLVAGETESALAHFQAALDTWKAAPPDPAGLVASGQVMAHYQSAWAHYQMGKSSQAEEALQQALASVARAPTHLRVEARRAIDQGLKALRVKKGQPAWQVASWSWRPLEDDFFIRCICRIHPPAPG